MYIVQLVIVYDCFDWKSASNDKLDYYGTNRQHWHAHSEPTTSATFEQCLHHFLDTKWEL